MFYKGQRHLSRWLKRCDVETIMNMPVSGALIGAAVPNLRLNERHQAVVRFATVQVFMLIYLQKFALGSPPFQISIPMAIFPIYMTWMLVRHNLSLSPSKLGLYLVFISCLLFSQLLVGKLDSFSSILQVALVYATMTITTDLPEAGHRLILSRFVKLMILPSLIIIFQYSWQKITGLPDFIDMDAMLPKSVLAQGYFYNAHYPDWTSSFTRPNGFFFLEPSAVSFYTAIAAIIEMTYFMRRSMLILLIVATVLSTGATGMTLLMIGVPLVFIRKMPVHVTIMAVIAVVIGLSCASMTGIELPLASRMSELDHPTSSSGGGRIIVPAIQ